MDATAAVISSHAAFLNRLDQVTLEQLALPSPCEGWDVTALLQHVTGGCRMSVALLGGAAGSEIRPIFSATAELKGDGLVEACRDSIEEAESLLVDLDEPGALVHFPGMDMPAAQLQSFRIVDMTLHAWDLARSIGVNEELPADAVELSLANLVAMEGMVPPGMFGDGASGALDEAADAQARLLDLSGRRP